VVVADQKIAGTVGEVQHCIVHITGCQLKTQVRQSVGQLGFQTANPMWRFATGQGVRHHQANGLPALQAATANNGAGLPNLLQHGERLLVEHLALWAQACGVRAPVDQFTAQPALKRLYTPRESGLCDAPQVGRF